MKRLIFIAIAIFCQFCAWTQNWQAIGNNLGQGGVRSFFADTATNELYATCTNITVNNQSSTQIIKWNGTNWTDAFPSTGSVSVIQLTKFQGQFYVTGTATGAPYRWDGANWQPATTVNGGTVVSLYNDGDSVLYALGDFTLINGTPANKIAKFDGINWYALDTIQWAGGVFGAAIRFQGDMYFCGTAYNSALNLRKLVRWDGQNWHSLGNAIVGNLCSAYCFCVFNNELYVGGYFDVATGNPGNFIARWDGNNWTQVGGGMTGGQVWGMRVFNNNLWAIGQYYGAGGVSATYLARYDGLDWCDIGTPDQPPAAIEVFNNEIYIGGNTLLQIDSIQTTGVAKWIGGNNADTCGHLTLGLEPDEQENAIQIFPNPIGQGGPIRITGLKPNDIVIVYDQLAREVFRSQVESEEIILNTGQLLSGLYFYHVETKEGDLLSGKFIIED